MADFIQIPISEMRVKLPKLRRLVQSGKIRIVCTHYGAIAGFLLPVKDIEEILGHENSISFSKIEEISLTDFREQLTEVWEKLDIEVDCYFLTFHTRRVLAFLSPRFMSYLSLPLLGDPDQLIFLSLPNLSTTLSK